MTTEQDYDPQYANMNAGAQRRPAPQIAAPAVIWQRGFWRATDSFDNGPEHHTPWHDEIDAVLLHIFLDLRKRCNSDATFQCPNYSEDAETLYLFRNKMRINTSGSIILEALTNDEMSVRHEVFNIRVHISGAVVVVIARLHLEYWELLFSIEFDFSDMKIIRDASLSSIRDLFIKLHKILIDRFSLSSDSISEVPHLSGEDKNDVNKIRLIIIEGLQTWVTDICGHAFKQSRIGRVPPSISRTGKIFADFFGLVYSIKLLSRPSENLPTASSHHLDIAKLPPPSIGHGYPIQAQVRGTSFDRFGVLRIVNAVWPMVRAMNDNLHMEDANGKPEYTVSLFQNGEALYMSSLGRLIPDSTKNEKVVYTILCSYSSKWRLGRLVDRIHSLGLLRLAALRDLSHINVASNSMNKAAAIFNRSGSQPLGSERMRTLQDNFYSIGRAEEDGRAIAVGLAYRVSRSKYYVAEYYRLLGMMGTRKVIGFQNYEEFVKRRLADAFEYINRVGRRYDDLGRQIEFYASLDRQHEAYTTQRLTLGQTIAVNEQTTATSRLLETAEIFSIVPFTYYMGMIIGHSVESFGDYKKWHDWMNYLLAFILSIILVCANRIYQRRFKKAAISMKSSEDI